MSPGSTSATPETWAWRSDVAPDPELPGGFLARPADAVAPDLLGCRLVSTVEGERTVGVVVEAEAYVGSRDPACHAAERIGRTRRNRSMFGPPGLAYVYFIYGMHWCLNVVTAREGDPQAVLVRALEPLEGRGVMARRRGRETDLTSGPARLCQALGVDGELDGHSLDSPPLRLLPGWSVDEARIRRSPRVGVTAARDWPLRFFLHGNRHVSGGGAAT